jgi:glycosyltransferase involved in cell wall biosynthesis
MIIYTFPPEYLAGMQIAAYKMSQYLARQSHNVYVITASPSTKGTKIQKKENFSIHRVGTDKKRWKSVISFGIKCFKMLEEIKPDIVHIHGLSLGLIGFFSKIWLKIPYLVTCQGSDILMPWKFKKIRTIPVLKTANKITMVSKYMKEKINPKYWSKIVVLPNGVDGGDFEKLEKKKLRQEFNIPEKEKIIIFVGRLHPIKGVKYLIQAMTMINLPEVTLFLVGTGPEEEKLRRLTERLKIENKVIFIGKVPNQKVHQYLALADIFVLPSLSEGFPIVIIEAMSAGLPIVATNCGGSSETITDGINGFLVPPKTSKMIAEKIKVLLLNKTLRGKMSSNNQRKIKEYQWPNIVRKLEEIYLEILEKATQ